MGEGEKCLGWDWDTEVEIKGCKPILLSFRAYGYLITLKFLSIIFLIISFISAEIRQDTLEE